MGPRGDADAKSVAGRGGRGDDQRPIRVHPRRHVGTLLEMIPAERSMCLNLVDDIVKRWPLPDGGGAGPASRTITAAAAAKPAVLFDNNSVPSAAPQHYSISIIPPPRGNNSRHGAHGGRR